MGDDTIKRNISKNITKYREASNMSQKELAKRLGVIPSRVSNWETGANCPTIDILFELCAVLGVSINDIYGVYPNSKFVLEYQEQEIIKKYRDLDYHGKKMVNFTLENEWERSTKSIMEGQVSFLTEEGDACCRVWRNGKFEEYEGGNSPLTSGHLNAAHARTDQEATDSDLKHDNDIMDDDNF